jgi:hypothetical protein
VKLTELGRKPRHRLRVAYDQVRSEGRAPDKRSTGRANRDDVHAASSEHELQRSLPERLRIENDRADATATVSMN